MPKLLSPSEIEQYRDQGFIHPIRVMNKAEAAALRARLERFERETDAPLKGSFRHKSHLLFT
jgi:non-haem Fe2+, alpha-ketoglutarate-dependent halogenase